MSQDSSNPDPGTDKLELHHRQQLSALVDGALVPDQARFLLRRLQHDRELAGCYERWQLSGQVLRGQFQCLAAPDFGARVAAAIQDEASAAPVVHAAAGGRNAWTRWGGGAAALAASVAAVALLVSRPQAPLPDAPATAPSVLAARPAPVDAAPEVPAVAAMPAVPAHVEAPVAAEPAAALAAVAPAPSVRARPRSQRPQAVVREPLPVATMHPVARTTITATATAADAGPAGNPDGRPHTDVARVAASATADAHEPFASVPPDARPWPRAALPQQASGAYTASFGGESTATRTFYPFEPRLPAAGEDASARAPSPAWDAPR